MGLRSSIGANEQYMRNIEDAQGWMDTTESALDSITDVRPRARTTCSSQGATDTADADVAQGDRRRDRPDHRGHQGDRRTPATATSTSMSGTATSIAPYKLGADDTYQGNEAGLDPAIAGHRARDRPRRDDVDQLGRARDARRRPGRRPTASCSTRCATSPTTCKANDGAALRGGDITGARRRSSTSCSSVRARNGAQTNRLESATTRLDQINGDAHRAALEHRGRRHRQDDDRLQLPERRLPGRPARRREHRAGRR